MNAPESNAARQAVATAARPSNAELDARRAAAMPRGVGIAFPIHAERARNAELWDAEGRRYIDFCSGIAVLATGHCHPRVVQAMQRQLDAFTHTAFQVIPYASAVQLAERLNRLTPGSHAKKTAFFTTGAEAVENAVKIARAHTRRHGVIALSGGFHGRTAMGLALTGKVAPYKIGFGPFAAGVYHAPAPVALHGVSAAASLQAIEQLFKTDIDAADVAAIIVEPVQGEGGFHPLPAEFLRGLRALCDTHGILLIADEIQTGFARTGRWFAMEHAGVLPDLMTLAKSLAGGMPLSAVCGRAEVMDAPAAGGLGGTYAANPVAIAAAHAVLDVIEDEGLCERAQQLGRKLIARLEARRAQDSGISDVRGLGSMVAVEFADANGLPDAARAKRVQQRARELGLLLLGCGVHGNAIRFLYPLTIEDSVFDEGLSALAQALEA